MTELENTERRLCERGWPSMLAKAAFDPFAYLIVLRSGVCLLAEEVRESATDGMCVVMLQEGESAWGYPCPRGVEIRIADVMAVVDAPQGS